MIAIMSATLIDALNTLPGRAARYGAREVVFRGGDPAVNLHVVEHGEVRLQRDGVDGNPLVLQRVGGGALLAEASLFATLHHCVAVASAASVTHGIARESVLARFRGDAAFAELWCRALASEVRVTRTRNEILRLRTVAARLDAWLPWNDGSFPPRGTWHTLAHELGVSPEALYREMAGRRESDPRA